MDLPHAKYPFVFPLMLFPVIKLFSLDFLIMRLLMIVLTLGSLYLAYILFKKCCDKTTAFAIILLTGFSSTLLHMSTWVLSEIPYMFFSLFSLYFFVDYSKEQKFLSKAGLLSLIFLLLALFTRTIGIALLLAFLCYLIFERKENMLPMFNLKKAVIIFSIVVIPLSLWSYRSHTINQCYPFQPEYRGVLNYQKEFFLKTPDDINSELISSKDFIIRTKNNIEIYAYTITKIILKQMDSLFIRVFVLMIFLYGFVLCFIKRRSILEYYFIFYLLVCILWWFSLTPERFLAPVIPFIFYYFFTGFHNSVRLCSNTIFNVKTDRTKQIVRLILGLCVFSLIATNFSFNPNDLKAERTKQFHPPELVSEVFSAINWIQNNTPQDSLIMSSRAPWVVMFTDRKTLTWPLFMPVQSVVESIVRNRVDYIVISLIHPEIYLLLHDFVTTHTEHFLLVFSIGETAIYRVNHDNFPIFEELEYDN